ncbi:MAG: hypothetical protein D6756_14500 [Cyanobacteria bacterium J083]|nr:MAG: hypothetical protein D6756_14500 [Cyanobacteria bacterium J083]
MVCLNNFVSAILTAIRKIHLCTTNPACGHTEPSDTCSAKVIQHRGELVGHTINEIASGGNATGFKQLSLITN